MRMANTARTILTIPDNILKPERKIKPERMSTNPHSPVTNAAIKKNIAAYLNISLASFIFGCKYGFEFGNDSMSSILIH